MKGLAVLGELTPRSIDAISSYGERLSSYIVTLAFRHFGMQRRARGFAPASSSPTGATRRPRRIFPRPTRGSPPTIPPLARNAVVVMGGFIGSTAGRRHHHAGPRRLGLHRVHRGRGHRRRRDPDLDRRGRHAHRRSHHPARRPSREDHLVRRSRRAGLFRRQGAASGHRGAGHREEHSGADSEFAPARSAGHAHRLRERCPAATW